MASVREDRRLERVEAVIGYRFSDRRLLREALTHPSVLGRGGASARNRRSYERLEFLGDRVLGLVVAHLLFERFAGDAEGALTQRHVALVNRDTLARVSARLELGDAIDVAPSEEGGGGRAKPALLADACEALLGALYLDGGLEAARRLIAREWDALVEALEAPPRDAKMALQEWAQARSIGRPAYSLVSASGPAHELHFVVAAQLTGYGPAHGEGRSKRDAERAAARHLLEIVGEGGDG